MSQIMADQNLYTFDHVEKELKAEWNLTFQSHDWFGPYRSRRITGVFSHIKDNLLRMIPDPIHNIIRSSRHFTQVLNYGILAPISDIFFSLVDRLKSNQKPDDSSVSQYFTASGCHLLTGLGHIGMMGLRILTTPLMPITGIVRLLATGLKSKNNYIEFHRQYMNTNSLWTR